MLGWQHTGGGLTPTQKQQEKASFPMPVTRNGHRAAHRPKAANTHFRPCPFAADGDFIPPARASTASSAFVSKMG
jgi:hypothetical protein